MMQRKDIPQARKWQPEHVYATIEDFESAFAAVQSSVKAIESYKGTLEKGKESVLGALGAYAEASEHLGRLLTYAMSHLNVDNSVPFYQGLAARVQSLAAQVQAAGAYLMPELMTLSEKTLAAYIGDAAFAPYDTFLKDLERMRAYTRNAQVETVLAAAQEAFDGVSTVYDMFTDVDMKLGKVRGEDGKMVVLSNARYGSMMESENRAVRRAAFERMHKAYGEYGASFAAMYAAHVKADVFNARMRGYESARMAALYPDDIPEAVYDNLIDVIHDAIPTLNAYLELRKRAFGVREVHLYDLYAPMTKGFTGKFDYDGAYELLIEAVAPLGKDYQDVVRGAKEGGWIDVYETPNKTGGAYSNGAAYGVHPYVLLNYREEIDGLFTLAHEMGHAMHSYYSNKTQPSFKSDYTIFVAEVASTCNEVLTAEYLLKKYAGNDAARAAVIARLLEGFRTTVFRQTMFAEFEHKAHQMEERGEPLTCEAVSAMYYALNETYYGGVCKVDAVVKNEWMRIPHFYNSFYVYKYATGFCAAIALAKGILEGGKEKVDAYRKFLTLGGSMTPIEELKVAGIDMSQPEPIVSALNYFAELIAEFSQMMD